MITGVIKNNARNGSKLIVTLPCSLYDLRNHLASIGITSEASKLTVGGTENIKVQLAAAERWANRCCPSWRRTIR